MKELINKINEFEKRGVLDVRLIALVSDSYSEVIFYGIIDGIRYQSNNMVEKGKINSDIVDGFYDDIVEIIKFDTKFDTTKMNIIKADSNGCSFEYDEKKCRTFKIIREWEKSLM
ncbi:MAG: hypothetical protein IJV15_06825 [Lachnospiraceae bacterium]|nr:hypothetical protein [Lachnospiraceae bacterium]